MEWHINDLSLNGQFKDPGAFRASLEPILRLRRRRPDLTVRIFCSRRLIFCPATATHNLQQAVLATGDRDFLKLALGWLANGGPFWDDDRATNQEDYFEFEDHDVTNEGLGEAARRRLLSVVANSFSFLDPPVNAFQHSPLAVRHGLREAPFGTVEIDNWWGIDELEAAAEVVPSSWGEVLAAARSKMDLLRFSDHILDVLRPQPFHSGIAERIHHLLKVLQRIAQETHADSSLSAAGMELLQNHFVGGKAWFTDESDSNKIQFRSEMTFPDPVVTNARLFCPWHGKVKIGQFRIHFEWPRPLGQRLIKVVYIGPKIAKR